MVIVFATIGGDTELYELVLTVFVAATSLTGLASVLRTLTFPLGPDGDPVLPAIIDWGDLTADQVVTSGTNATHTYAAGSYVATYRDTGASGITYTSATITVT